MQDFVSKISGIAMLALACLPIAALATASHAQTVVKVADIDVLTPQGVSELNEKLAILRTAQLERASQTFAAR